MSKKKRVFIALILALCALGFWKRKDLQYGLSQARGQVLVLWSRRSMEDLSSTSEGRKHRAAFHQINAIRQYGHLMGLRVEDAYTGVCLPGTCPRLVVLTAAPAFSTKAHTWWYPIIGRLPYRGFFSPALLEEEMRALRCQEFDVDTGEVEAWSGLGWYDDPVMPGMLRGNEASRAVTLLHELVHKTFFVPGEGPFNENLAEFLGEQLAIDYLGKRYGFESAAVMEARRNGKERHLRVAMWDLVGHALDSLYEQTLHVPTPIRAKKKKLLLAQLSLRMMDQPSLSVEQKKSMIRHLWRGGNAAVGGHRTYFQLFDSLEHALAAHHKGNLREMIRDCKSRYPD
jgi:predicted aminopeptidase